MNKGVETSSGENKIPEIVAQITPGSEDYQIKALLWNLFENPNAHVDYIEEIKTHIRGQLSDTQISQVTLDRNNATLKASLSSGKEVVFDLLDVFGEKTTQQELQHKRERLNKEVIESAEQLDQDMGALEYLFTQSLKKYNPYLTPGNILETDQFGPELQGLNIAQISGIIRKKISAIDYKVARSGMKVSQTQQQDILANKQKYLEMTMGIGEKYEGGSSAFAKKLEDIERLTDEVLGSQSIEESFVYLEHTHTQISNNHSESTSVARGYKIFTQSLHQKILKKIIATADTPKEKEKLNDRIISFVEIITGRKIIATQERKKHIGGAYWSINPHGKPRIEHTYNSIKDTYKDAETANQALMYLVAKEGGVLQKLEQNDQFKIDDTLVPDKNADKISKSALSEIDTFAAKYPEFDGRSYLRNNDGLTGVDGSTKENIFNLPGKKYIELNMSQKILVSYLVRLQKFISEEAPSYIEDYKRRRKLFLDRGQRDGVFAQELNIKGYLQQGFTQVFNDTQDFVTDTFEDNFEAELGSISTWSNGKSGEYFGLTDNAQVINLLNDINGMGLDLSDNSVRMGKTGGKILGIIALSIAVGGPLALAMGGTAIAQGAVIGVASGPIANMIMGKGYDTEKEMMTDMATDALVNGTMGAGFGYGAATFGSKNLNVFSRGGFNKNNAIFSTDIVSGMGFEMYRMGEVDKKFHGGSFFDNAGKGFENRPKNPKKVNLGSLKTAKGL